MPIFCFCVVSINTPISFFLVISWLSLPSHSSSPCAVRRENRTERADSLDVRTEDLQSEFDRLERRCLSAEREVAAQKELIEVRKSTVSYAVHAVAGFVGSIFSGTE